VLSGAFLCTTYRPLPACARTKRENLESRVPLVISSSSANVEPTGNFNLVQGPHLTQFKTKKIHPQPQPDLKEKSTGRRANHPTPNRTGTSCFLNFQLDRWKSSRHTPRAPCACLSSETRGKYIRKIYIPTRLGGKKWQYTHAHHPTPNRTGELLLTYWLP
jgi:hypothetical protein